MTDAFVRTGYPILEMASHVAPYRTVLAPPPEFGIGWRRAGTMLAAALRDSATSATEPAVAVQSGVEHTVFARSRLLEGAEVGADQPVTDGSSRPIVVTEGVVFAGPVTGDPEVVLRSARGQFAKVIQDCWDDSGEFRGPRHSEPVTCHLAPVEEVREPANEEPEPETSTPENGTDGSPRAAAVATPPARPARHRRLLPVVLVVLVVLVLVP